jgi:hypothetical protein
VDECRPVVFVTEKRLETDPLKSGWTAHMSVEKEILCWTRLAEEVNVYTLTVDDPRDYLAEVLSRVSDDLRDVIETRVASADHLFHGSTRTMNAVSVRTSISSPRTAGGGTGSRRRVPLTVCLAETKRPNLPRSARTDLRHTAAKGVEGACGCPLYAA